MGTTSTPRCDQTPKVRIELRGVRHLEASISPARRSVLIVAAQVRKRAGARLVQKMMLRRLSRTTTALLHLAVSGDASGFFCHFPNYRAVQSDESILLSRMKIKIYCVWPTLPRSRANFSLSLSLSLLCI